MWTVKNRARYNRDHLRYPSDTTDEEWTEMAGLIPPARRGGRKRTVNIREVLNGLLYVLGTGCQWRALYVRCREQAERTESPTACIIDSQSVKSAEKGGRRLIRQALMRANRSKAKSATC